MPESGFRSQLNGLGVDGIDRFGPDRVVHFSAEGLREVRQ